MNETQQQLPWWLPDPIIVFFLGFLALMYFMTIRPQQKRMKALQAMMDGLEKGDEVVAAGSGQCQQPRWIGRIQLLYHSRLRATRCLEANFSPPSENFAIK